MELNKTTDYGKIAYQETSEIKREMFAKPAKYVHQIKSFFKSDIHLTSGELLTFHFESENKNVIKLHLSVMLGENNAANNFKLVVCLNNAKYESIDCNIHNSVPFTYYLEFFAHERNVVSISVVSLEQVSISQFHCTLIGSLKTDDLKYSECILESSNLNNEIVVVKKDNSSYTCNIFNNVTHLLKNYHDNVPIVKSFHQLFGVAYNLELSATQYKNQKLYFLLQKENDNKLYLENLEQTQSIVVNQQLPQHCFIQGLHSTDSSLIYFELAGNAVSYKVYDKNLVLKMSKTSNVQFKNAVKKAIPIYKKGTTFSKTADFIVVSQRNEVCLINVTYVPHLSSYEVNKTPVFLGYGMDAYAMELNGLLTVFIADEQGVKKNCYQYYAEANYYKRISTQAFFNARLGFLTSENVPFYYYLKNFDLEQRYD